MSQTLRTTAGFAAGALVVAVAALTAHAGPSVAQSTSTTDPVAHTITVSATGSTTVVPDVARISLGVTLNRPTVKAARADAAAKMTNVITAIRKLGVDEKDIRTVGLNLYPQYSNGSPSRVVGYGISEQLQVTIRDLDKAGDAVDAATAAGATDVGGISFELADPDAAQNQARAAAVAKAKTAAQAMAQAGGVSLGSVVSITDASPVVGPVYYGARAGAVPAAGTPVQPGTQDISATITVVFSIG